MAGGQGQLYPLTQIITQVIWGKACQEEGCLQPRKIYHLPVRPLNSSMHPPPVHTCLPRTLPTPPPPPQGALSAPKVGALPKQSQKWASEQPRSGAKLSFYELPEPSHGTPSR